MQGRPRGELRAAVPLVRRLGTVLVGSALLAATFRFGYDDPWFYACSALLGLCWVAGWRADGAEAGERGAGLLRNVLWGAGSGVALAVACTAGVLIVRHCPLLGESAFDVLGPVEGDGTAVVVLTALAVGACEELMFRGAVYRWFTRRPVLWSTVVYVAVTVVTANLSLVVAAVLLGAVTGMLRSRTGSVVAPVVCHLVWSALLLVVLPGLVSRV